MLYFFINPASRSGRGLLQWKKTEKYIKIGDFVKSPKIFDLLGMLISVSVL